MTGDAAKPTPRSYAFGPFLLIPERQLLLQGEKRVRIGGRALDILTALVERPGDVVNKRELLSRVWPDTVVEEANLKVNMTALRRVLGEGPGSPQYIATVVGRGYRFIGSVESSAKANSAAEARSILPAGHNLPTGTTQVFGRADAIEDILRDLKESRLVSIVGPGGIGKTTVAVTTAERVVGKFEHGVWLVDFSPLKDAALVPNTIAMTIGLAAHSANMLAALCDYLRDREMLLIFDSCEHIIDSAAACANRILADAGGVKILATSREPLGVKGERVRRLSGLAMPQSSIGLKAAEARTFPAVQLFVDRATDRLESFLLDDANTPPVAEICRKLDGLALAIELAATRVDSFDVHELLKQLDDRLSLLKGHRASAERHRTLTATIDWSYDLLTERERALMRRLSIFAGAFNLSSACAVATDGRIDRAKVVEDLANIVAKSLVAADVGDVEVQYRQLDTSRAYALEKLAASGELDGVRRRHAEHFLALAERAASEVDRLSRAEWLARYTHRLDDIRNALNWASADPDAAALGVKLTVAAIPFWKILSLVDECRSAAERVLEDRFEAYRSAHDELTLRQTVGATLLHVRGPLPEVKAALSMALQIAESLGDSALQLECLDGISEYELWTGDSRAALAVSEKTRAIEAKGQLFAGGSADAQAGSALEQLGALSASRRHLETVVNLPLSSDSRTDVARFEFNQRLIARGSLASVLWLQGFPDQAVNTARQQREEAEASNYAVSYCYALLLCSATMLLHVRNYDAANRYISFGLQQATTHGLTFWRTMTTGGSLCRWQLYTGHRPDLAELRRVLAKVREGGFRMKYPHYLTNFGEALARQGDLQGGLAAIDDAMALCEETGQTVIIPEIMRIKGNVIRFEDPTRSDRAAECYLRSIGQARRDGTPSWELRSAISLVKLARARGGDTQAEEMLAAAYNRFTEGFTTGDLRRARTLLDNPA